MKLLLVLASTLAVALAFPEPPSNFYQPQTSYEIAPQSTFASSGGYSNSQQQQVQSSPQVQNNYGPPSSEYGAPGGDQQVVHKHVYVHIAPKEPEYIRRPKPVRIAPKPEKHYKIIFIKAPTESPYEQPDIPELPPQPETKTLVYVLLKRPDPTQEIILPKVQPTKPSKPEVYFIRYKAQEQSSSDGGYPASSSGSQPGDSYGAPAQTPSDSYGLPN